MTRPDTTTGKNPTTLEFTTRRAEKFQGDAISKTEERESGQIENT